MSWFIGHDGRVECLDEGPALPWFIGEGWTEEDEAERAAALAQADAEEGPRR